MSSATIQHNWTWRGFPITYRQAGRSGPAVVMVHGFGASSGHWRHNLPVLGETCRCFAIDLLGFGGSAKPQPGSDVAYTFETWGEQIADFCEEAIGEPAFLIGNSIGCIAAMQAAVSRPAIARGVAALNISLRMLHDRKRGMLPWYRRFGAPAMQKALSYPAIAEFFFSAIARPSTVRSVLNQAYRRPEAVTDELVQLILEPARDPGAVGVFVAFTRYSQGPLAEDLLPRLPCPAIVLWGTDDPWEPFELGREYGNYETVERFIPLEGLGHCPQDEAPEIVNPILQEWILATAAA